MKKILSLFAVALVMLGFASPSLAGPSRALVQELGSVQGADEINISANWSGQGLQVTGTGDTSTTVGGKTNLSIGGIALSSVNIGLTQNLELRLGQLPGTTSYLTLPTTWIAPQPVAVTLKESGLGLPGLGIWLGYGSNSFGTAQTASVSTSGSSLRVGAAYTWAGPLILNGALGYGQDTLSTASSNTTSLEVSAAALYPLKSNLLVGIELLYDSIDSGGGGPKATVLAPALGARATAGNWTIDAIAALVGTSVKIDNAPTLSSTASATVVGVPTLRINYKL